VLAEKGETWRWRRMRREEVNVDVKMKEDVQEVAHDKRRLSPLPAGESLVEYHPSLRLEMA
jgi:hypothetical protein